MSVKNLSDFFNTKHLPVSAVPAHPPVAADVPAPLTMNDKITNLVEKTHSNDMWSIPQMLRAAADEIEQGKEPCTRAMVLTLNDPEQVYQTCYYAANISASQMLALLEVTKSRLLEEMGYG